jgi:hypothetical protein
MSIKSLFPMQAIAQEGQQAVQKMLKQYQEDIEKITQMREKKHADLLRQVDAINIQKIKEKL